MERCWLFLSTFLFLIGWSFNSHSAESCHALLGGETPKVLISESSKVKKPELIYSIKLGEDSRFTSPEVSKEDYLDLFKMLGQTQFFNVGEKITLEKGSLFLGKKIDDIVSVQAEYMEDKPNKSYHLVRLNYFIKNGQEDTITKEPLDYKGTRFVKDTYHLVFEKGAAKAKVLSGQDVKTQSETEEGGYLAYALKPQDITQAGINFPLEISGAAFAKVKNWAKVIPHLDHSEINVVDSINQQKWSIAKGSFRRLMEFAKDRIVKQVFGVLVVYVLVDYGGDIASKYAVNILQNQGATVSVKVKETKSNGNVKEREEKFKIILPKKTEEGKTP